MKTFLQERAEKTAKPMRPPLNSCLAQPDFATLAIEKWLTPKEVAGHFGLTPFSAYRWVSEGLIPEQFIRFCGMWRIRLHPDVIPILQRKFAENHD